MLEKFSAATRLAKGAYCVGLIRKESIAHDEGK